MATSWAASSAVPGITDVVLNLEEFDFIKAFRFIKKIPIFNPVPDWWPRLVADASMVACDDIYPTSELSILWFSIKFLDTFWNMLFGKTTGSSPWYHLLKRIKKFECNGSADNLLELTSLRRRLLDSGKEAESIILNKMCLHFPMKINMPKTVTVATSDKPSTRPAEDDIDSPKTKRLRLEK